MAIAEAGYANQAKVGSLPGIPYTGGEKFVPKLWELKNKSFLKRFPPVDKKPKFGSPELRTHCAVRT